MRIRSKCRLYRITMKLYSRTNEMSIELNANPLKSNKNCIWIANIFSQSMWNYCEFTLFRIVIAVHLYNAM